MLRSIKLVLVTLRIICYIVFMTTNSKSNYRPELYTKDAKKDRFYRVATRRINKLLNNLRLIGNTANTNLYLYKDEEIDKIFSTIENKIIEVKSKFRRSKDKDTFSF